MNLTRLIINASNYLLTNRGRPHMNHDSTKGARVFAGLQLGLKSRTHVNTFGHEGTHPTFCHEHWYFYIAAARSGCRPFNVL